MIPNHLSEADAPSTKTDLVLGFKRNVVVLSATSFLTDASNNMIFPLMVLFLDNVLGVKPSLIGLIQGVVEAAASWLKMLSGWLSDKMGRRKVLVVGGYWTSTLAKVFMVIAGSWWFVLMVRFVDRIGKGLRSAPAKALVADAGRQDEVGRAFGFYKMMDVAGGLVGLLASAGIVYLVQSDQLSLAPETYQVLVLVGIVPALLGAMLVPLFLQEQRHRRPASTATTGLGCAEFDVRFWLFLFIIFLFALGNFSDAFLTLRAQGIGASTLQLILLLVAFRAVYSLVALPAGALSDRFGRKRILVGGWMLYALVYLGFALVSSSWQIWILYLLYGLCLGATKGVERAFVADLVPASGQRGTAYGMLNATVGLTALPASVIAGALWQALAPGAAFLLGAALMLLAACLMALVMR